MDKDSKKTQDESQQPEGMSRRFFLKGGSSLAAIGITTLAGAGLGTALPAEAVAPPAAGKEGYTQSFANLGSGNGETLVKMARDIFPHDKLPDQLYADAVAGYDADAESKNMIMSGLASMDAIAKKRFGKRYVDVALEADRLEVLYAIEDTPFFQKIKGGLVTGLYNSKKVWPLLGYEGSSWQYGGYLDRGFNDIDWL